MAQLSPGVEVKEIDLSIVVPKLGASIACFAGIFEKGEVNKYKLITNVNDLIYIFGKPHNMNYNDWFQAYSFLQYSNKLYISRAVDRNGTLIRQKEKITHAELGKIKVSGVPSFIIGDYITFSKESEERYRVSNIKELAGAVKQVDEITINSVITNDVFTLTNNGINVSVTASASDTVETIAAQLGTLIENVDTNATNVVISNEKITVSASIAGIAMNNETIVGDITITNKTPNKVSESYEIEIEGNIDFSTLNLVGKFIYKQSKSYNAIATAPIVSKTIKSALELHKETILIENMEDYEVLESSIPIDSESKLKFIAKSFGESMNGIEIAIAKEVDFASGTSLVFKDIPLNSLFDNSPFESNNEIAIVIRDNGVIKETYIVSLLETAIDFRNKSIYIENVLNLRSQYVYCKVNTRYNSSVESCIYIDKVLNEDGTIKTNAIDKVLRLSNGSDGIISPQDIGAAYGSVSENTIFGAKENIDIDIIIANEQARFEAGTLASDRRDCLAIHGTKYEDIVGLSTNKILENMIKDNTIGEMNRLSDSYNAYFGNYKKIYDKYNDTFRWINIAGDVAGVRAKVSSELDAWCASAGYNNGIIKNAIKMAYQPNLGMRDILYKNRINPVLSFPGKGVIIFGQKTNTSKPSAFDRINVRLLFNLLERSISRMAEYQLFEINDEFSRNAFVSRVNPFLETIKSGRGIYDYYVQCDTVNNTPDIIDSNQFIASIFIKPARTIEFIELNFVSVATGVSFNSLFV